MSHPEKSQSSYRLDFICNKDSPSRLPDRSNNNLSQYLNVGHSDYRSNEPESATNNPISFQSSCGINFPSTSTEAFSNTCYCCGSVHYTYSNHFQPKMTPCFSESNNIGFSQKPQSVISFSLPPEFSSPHALITAPDSRPVEFDSLNDLNSTSESLTTYSSRLNFPSSTESSHAFGTPQIFSGYRETSSPHIQVNQKITQTDRSSSPKSDISASSNEKDEHVRCLWASCSAEFSTADDLIPHLSNSHLSGRERDSKCKWEYCQDYEGGTDELLKHLNDVHLGLEQVKLTCQWEDCHSQFTSFEELTEHLSENHVGSGRSFYVCGWSRCQRDRRPFVQRQKVMRHLQSHTGDKPYMCMVCEKRFAQSTVMSQHLRTHTGEKPYKCPISECGKKFSIPGSLTGHLRSHKGEKPYSCKFSGCERQFGNSSNLSKHIRTHTGERPFRCYNNPPCPKRFARPDQAARHMKIHTNDQSQRRSQS